jgi:hypothetical protein
MNKYCLWQVDVMGCWHDCLYEVFPTVILKIVKILLFCLHTFGTIKSYNKKTTVYQCNAQGAYFVVFQLLKAIVLIGIVF